MKQRLEQLGALQVVGGGEGLRTEGGAAVTTAVTRDDPRFTLARVRTVADPVPAGGAMVVGTGRSDYPNQINNSLVFPGVFRGALDNRVSKITDEMKLKAAKSLAALVKKPTAQKIVPGAFEKGIAAAVAKAIR